MTGVALALALSVAGCAKGQSSEPATAADQDEDPGDTSADEEAEIGNLDEYLEGEGEDVSDSGDEDSGAAATADDGGEDAAAGEDKPRETPKERSQQIYDLIKAKRPTVAACYKSAKAKDAKIGTKLAIKIVLTPEGKLKGDPTVAEDRTDIASEEVRKCAIDVVKSVEYPAHPKGMETTFTYPFGF